MEGWKKKSARKRKWKFTVEILTTFDVNIKIWTFLTFNARNIFCFGIKGIPSSIYEIGDRYHLPKSQLWTASFAFTASKKRAKHYDDQPHCTYQSITIMQKMKWLMKSSKLLHDYLLMLLQQALKSWSNFNLVLFGKGREIHKTTLTNAI